jgi:hypothetical protein
VTATFRRSGRTAPLDLCALIVKGAWPPYSSRVKCSGGLTTRWINSHPVYADRYAFGITLSRSTGVLRRIKSWKKGEIK